MHLTARTPISARRPAPAAPRRAAVLLSVISLLLGGLGSAALAEPTQPPNEGSSKLATMRQNLEAAAVGYLDAEAALSGSRKRQAELAERVTFSELDLVRLRVGVGKYAAEAYKTGRLGVLGVMINARSPDAFLAKATALDKIAQRDQGKLAELVAVQRQAAEAKAEVDAEVRKQAALLDEMTKRKKAAERALSAMGGYATTGWVDPNSPLAKPAPRNANGSWPKEGCTINDPTTGGCITPRTLHAMQQAKSANFKRYTACYRSESSGEHPKGRACDFSSSVSGFSNSSAGGDDKLYGDKLASFFIKNASRLGVLYVIWYCKVWINGGWKTYTRAGSKCGDDPAGDHTNHVHLSVY